MPRKALVKLHFRKQVRGRLKRGDRRGAEDAEEINGRQRLRDLCASAFSAFRIPCYVRHAVDALDLQSQTGLRYHHQQRRP